MSCLMSRCLCVSVEVFCFFGIIIFDAVLYWYIYRRKDGIQPFRRGFFCNDESIMKPYKKESLSFQGTLTAGVLISLIMIMLLEIGNNFAKSKSDENRDAEDDGKRIGPVVIPKYIIRMLHHMAIFGFVLAVLLAFCDVIQVLSGRLRPHFLAVCKPNTTLFNCSTGYITADVCTGDPLKVKNARCSFPSGHTTVSSYCLVFVAFCLQAVVCLRRYKLLRTLLQATLVFLGLAVGLSRIRDYYHHWLDVVAGFIFGTFTAWFVATKLIRLFDEDKLTASYTVLSNEEEEEVRLTDVTKQRIE